MTRPEAPAEELEQLRRFRSPLTAVAGGLLVVIAAVSLWSTRDAWRYYLRDDKAAELGTAEKALAQGTLGHNTYVRINARPLLRSEGNARTAITNPGCLTGPTRRIYYTLMAETGDRLVVRTQRSLKEQQIAHRTSFTGRLLRINTSEPPHRLYRRFVYQLTDCRNHPKTCDKFLLVSADIATQTLVAAVGKPKAVLRGIKGESIEVTSMTPLYLAFQFPGEYEYTVRDTKKAEAIERVKKLGLSYIWVGSSRNDQDFIIQATQAQAEPLIRSQRRGSGYQISARTAGYHVRFGWLKRDGDHLKITKATKGFPELYRIVPQDKSTGPARLVPVAQRGSPRIRIAQVSKAAYHGPRQIPKHAWLLLEGVRPRQARAAGLIALGLALLALGGLTLLGLGLRRPAR